MTELSNGTFLDGGVGTAQAHALRPRSVQWNSRSPSAATFWSYCHGVGGLLLDQTSRGHSGGVHGNAMHLGVPGETSGHMKPKQARVSHHVAGNHDGALPRRHLPEHPSGRGPNYARGTPPATPQAPAPTSPPLSAADRPAPATPRPPSRLLPPATPAPALARPPPSSLCPSCRQRPTQHRGAAPNCPAACGGTTSP